MHIGDQESHDVVIMLTATYCGDAHRKLPEMGRVPCPWQFCESAESVSVYVVDTDYEDGDHTNKSPVNMEHGRRSRITVNTLHEDYVRGDIRGPGILSQPAI